MSKRIYKGITAVVLCALLLMTQVIGIIPAAQDAQAAPGDYFSPFDVAYSPDGTKIAASDSTKAKVHIINASAGTVTYSVSLNGTPKCVAWKDNTSVYVAEYGARTVAVVNSTNGTVSSRFNVGPKPMGLAYVSGTSKLYVTDFGLKDVRVVDVTTGNTTATVTLPDNYPNYITVTPNNSYAIVGYATPTGNATSSTYASRVTFITLSSNTIATNVSLPFGSTNLRAIKCSPNGTWAYIAHMFGRTNLPTTQLTKGWVYTNAISVIRLSDRTYYTTFLLDRMSEGFSQPWGVAVSSDSNTLWVSSAGCHQITKIDMGLLNQLMAGTIPSAYIQSGANLSLPNPLQRKKYRYTRPFSDVWFYVKQNSSNRSLLKDDLSALWGAGVQQIIRLEDNASPRGIALSPDGTKLAVAGFFTGKVYTLNTSTNAVAQSIAVGSQPADDAARAGYKLYTNAIDTQQHWLACTSCHPEGRPDGMNWDLLNDGVGNPKNAKSHLNAHMTAPSMAHGIRKDYTVAVDAGYKYLKFVIPTQTQLDNCAAHIRSLVAEPDPYRNANGTMTASALSGKALFDANCKSCHSGPYMTDYQMHTTTYTDSLDSNQNFDTPSLVEAWRTAPYLHNGTAATIKDAMNALGYGSSLTDTQKNQIQDYVLQFGANTNSLGNIAPNATAGYDWVLCTPATTYQFVSAASVDDGLPGSTVTYTWSKTSGPACSFDNVNLLQPTVTLSGGVGTYVFQIVANDTALQTTDTCTIIYTNPTPTTTPTPIASPTPSAGLPAVKITGTAFGTSPPWAAGSEYDKVFDGNTGTFFDFSSGSGGYTGIDTGSGKQVSKIRFFPRSGYEWRMAGGKFQGSNTASDSGYVDLYTIGSTPAAGWNEVSVSDVNGYRWLRYLGPTDGFCNVAEVQFYRPVAAAVMSQGKTVSYDSQQTGNEATKGNDGNSGTRWCANDGGLNHWWQVDLGANYDLTSTEISFESPGYAYGYTVSVSTDNVNFTTVADKTSNADTGATQNAYFNANARYVRITVTALGSGRWASFWECKVYAARNNVAIGKTVTYDSQQGGNEATKGVDDNDASRWCAADGNVPHWYTVDMGSSVALTGSSVVWESYGYAYKYKVESSTDNTNWTMRADKQSNSQAQMFMTDNWSATARYVRITVTGLDPTRWASFWEFKIYNN